MSLTWCLLISLAGQLPADYDPTQSDQTPQATASDFTRDVIPMLTKAGCNAGACHGSFQGRGGMQLSLLGFDPATDYDTLVNSGRGRRVKRGLPEESLLLQKASGRVPHGGGRRIATESAAYRVLRDWIAQGLPRSPADAPQITSLTVTPSEILFPTGGGQPIPLQVTARYADKSQRDVTPWALYDVHDVRYATVSRGGHVTHGEPGKAFVTVRYQGQVAIVGVTMPFSPSADFTGFQPRNFIDELTQVEWRRLGVTPAPLCSDTEFVRRLSIDLIGTMPTPAEVRTFVDSKDPEKRSKLIESLLERPEYVDFWTLRWGDLLRAHRRYLGDKGLASFQGWIRQAVRESKPLDQLARELLTAKGNLFSSGPVAYFFVDEKPEDLAETTSQVFLGVRLQCTKCHHHPMEVWSQQDYYGLAAFFTQLEPKDTLDNGRFGGVRSLRAISKPSPNRPLAVAAPPRAFGDTLTGTSTDLREHLADWMTKPDNPWFARNFANRYWAWMNGRGLVEPVDDLRATNPASHPALLDALTKHLVDSKFDPKSLLRLICNSSVYQRASELAPTRDRDGIFATHRVPRRMSAEVLLDAVNQVTGASEAFPQVPAGTRAISLPDPSIPSYFLATFGRPLRNSPCECARGSSPDLSQALHLVNSAALHGKIVDQTNGRLWKLIKQHPATPEGDSAIIEDLYLTTLARRPTTDEVQTIRELLSEGATRTDVFEDLVWTLLNSSEFLFNH